MKTCSVCNATVFDDMDVCYGCMHRFEEDEGAIGFSIPVRADACDPALRTGDDTAPSETKCAPDERGGTAWKLRIELQQGGVTARTWVMDLFSREPTSTRL